MSGGLGAISSLPRSSFNHQFQPFGHRLSIFFFGVGGRTVSKLQPYDLHVVRRLSPDVIILEIGKNYLSFMRPEIVGSAIVDLVRLLSSEFSVRVIGVSHVIPRGILYSHTLEFSQRAKILCDYKGSFGTFSLSFCWTHRDLFPPR